jgi:hypothetical protein
LADRREDVLEVLWLIRIAVVRGPEPTDSPSMELEEIHHTDVGDGRSDESLLGLVRAGSDEQTSVGSAVQDEFAYKGSEARKQKKE